MEVTVRASLPAEGNVKINTGHVDKANVRIVHTTLPCTLMF